MNTVNVILICAAAIVVAAIFYQTITDAVDKICETLKNRDSVEHSDND